jgi:tetratricopeptide (TPR) repeat protein
MVWLGRTYFIVLLVLKLTLVLTLPVWPASALVSDARKALDADRVEEAIGLLERAVADDAKDPAALAWLGNAQVRKARTVPPIDGATWVKRGFATLDEAVERFPDAFVVYLVRGVTGGNVPDMFNKRDAAVKDLRTVMTLREKNPLNVPDTVMPVVYLNLGHIYKKAGKIANARAVWEQGRRAFPGAPETKAIDAELKRL